jgi:hypothetical protein
MVLGCVVTGGFVAALFFSSRHIVFGPSNSHSLVLAATFIALRDSALGPAELAVLLAFLIGICQVAAGLMRFGQVTQFISRPVVIGYSAAIGVLLAFSQLHHLLGASRPAGSTSGRHRHRGLPLLRPAPTPTASLARRSSGTHPLLAVRLVAGPLCFRRCQSRANPRPPYHPARLHWRAPHLPRTGNPARPVCAGRRYRC